MKIIKCFESKYHFKWEKNIILYELRTRKDTVIFFNKKKKYTFKKIRSIY